MPNIETSYDYNKLKQFLSDLVTEATNIEFNGKDSINYFQPVANVLDQSISLISDWYRFIFSRTMVVNVYNEQHELTYHIFTMRDYEDLSVVLQLLQYSEEVKFFTEKQRHLIIYQQKDIPMLKCILKQLYESCLEHNKMLSNMYEAVKDRYIAMGESITKDALLEVILDSFDSFKHSTLKKCNMDDVEKIAYDRNFYISFEKVDDQLNAQMPMTMEGGFLN